MIQLNRLVIWHTRHLLLKLQKINLVEVFCFVLCFCVFVFCFFLVHVLHWISILKETSVTCTLLSPIFTCLRSGWIGCLKSVWRGKKLRGDRRHFFEVNNTQVGNCKILFWLLVFYPGILFTFFFSFSLIDKHILHICRFPFANCHLDCWFGLSVLNFFFFLDSRDYYFKQYLT